MVPGLPTGHSLFFRSLRQYSPRGLEVISINIATNDPLPRVQSFQEVNKMPYRILYDEKTEVSRVYGVFGIPTSLLIDRDGIISTATMFCQPMLVRFLTNS